MVIYLGVAPGRALSFLGPSIENLLVQFEASKEIHLEAQTPEHPLPLALMPRHGTAEGIAGQQLNTAAFDVPASSPYSLPREPKSMVAD
jgi:hypothetical protein